MKKVLIFTKSMGIGGTEKVILSLCKGLKDQFEITVLSGNGENVDLLKKMGIRYVQIENVCTHNPFVFLKNYLFIKTFIKKNKFDVIHTHHRMCAFYISLIKGLSDSVLIHTMHNSFDDKKKLTRFSLKKFIIIACGKTVFKNTIDNYKFSFDQVKCIENGLDNSFEKTENELISNLKKSGCFVFGFVGRLCDQKGTDLLANAFMELSKKQNIKLVIFGSGDFNSFFPNATNVYYGGITDSPLNIISQLDCLVLPSRWEGLPLNIIEAFSVNTLVLCSDIPNNTELVSDETGVLFKNGNENDLVQKILEIEKKDFASIKMNAYVKYQKKYSFNVFCKKYKEIYLSGENYEKNI